MPFIISGPQIELQRKYNLLGQKFGNLEVIGKAVYRAIKNPELISAWICKCTCGRELPIVQGRLLGGIVTHCGCITKLARASLVKRGKPGSFYRVLGHYRHRAKRRTSIEFGLTDDEAFTIMTSNCWYCNIPPSQIGKHRLKSLKTHKNNNCPDFIYNGLDRVDNTQGYTLDNVVSSCKPCNLAKRDMSQADFLTWLDRAASHQALKRTAATA